ncbi:AraC family transcriptional regulator [Mucilaginibacter aquariorum]|uniref:AraC family transcriptional regulator n=1 Tax=Mucilaginibacter aquariorum TaxID=2967225 RepID=A0ABT1SZS0_9SPHI|nr:helix-turn-helix transcriptional regulator [Mucilaginibacter aquariorum]MCQ6957710.1 AraC family transcriptional regulator [Mucilaginibacter aquariorum]
MKSIPIYDIGTLSQQQEHELQISRFGVYIESHHKDLHSAHKHSFYHLVLFTKGGGNQTIDFQNFQIKPFQIYFMTPGQVHSWDFDGEVDGYIINFSTTFFQSFLMKANYLEDLPFFTGNVGDAVINIPVQLQDKIIGFFEELIIENERVNPLGIDLVKAIMVQLFIHIARLNEGMDNEVLPSYNYTLLRNFQKLIEKNFMQLKLPKGYAQLLYITPNHLNALCNDVLGIPAGEVIRNRVILEAKRMLINKDVTVQEISNYLNFADNSYFTKFFKKKEGLTPDEFRKKIIKQHGPTK